jgi:hypothetical protein
MGWTFSARLAGRDLEAEGILLVTFVDAAGRPVAGARPYVAASFAEAIDLDFHFLAADLGSVVEGATETTASGAVLVVGGPTVALSAEHDAIVFATVGVAIPAGGAFVETIGPDAP